MTHINPMTPTPERQCRDAIRAVPTDVAGLVAHQVEAPLVLDRLLLTRDVRDAGLLLAEMYQAAGGARRAALGAGSARGGEVSDIAAECGRVYRDALRAVPRRCRSAVIAVCCLDQEDARSYEGLLALALHWERRHRDRDPMVARVVARLRRG